MASSEQAAAHRSAELELQAARRHLEAGRSADAERSYVRALEMLPDSIEALVFLGNAAQSRGDGGAAVSLLSRAAKVDPANVDILMHLGAVYSAAERFDAARYVLERAVRLAAGRNPHARLVLAGVLELDERPDLALLHYCRALMEAQRLGRWTSHENKMTDLKAQAEHARQYVAAGRRAWFERVLLGSGNGAAAKGSARIVAALDAYLHGRQPKLSDPRQRAGMMYVPGLVTSGFIDTTTFDWLDRAPAAIAPCADEMQQCVSSAVSSGQTASAQALRVPVLKAGVQQYEPRRHAPRLLSALRALPLADVQHHSPDVDIIALRAGARMARHHGRMNSLCWVLVNPLGGSAFRVSVAGESRVLQSGAALVVDPSLGVEFLNVAESPALGLTLEVWHPDLNDSEKRGLSELITAMIDFDNRLQELD